MLRNYLVVAWRNLLRNRVYSVVNVLGLTLALGCGLLIFQFVWHELRFDGFHEKGDRIHLVYQHDQRGANTPLAYSSMLSDAKQEALAANYPEIIRAARVTWIQPQVGHRHS